MLQPIESFDVKNKTVLVRVDFNVPVTPEGKIRSDVRICAHIPTIKDLCAAGAKVVLLSHLGRPTNRNQTHLSLKNVADRLAAHLKKPVNFCSETIGPKAEAAIKALHEGDVLLLENVRFCAGESTNDPEFAQQLANMADIYLNDAFAMAHRAHASIVGVKAIKKEYGMGRVMQKELETLGHIMSAPKRPFVMVIGGSKMSTKLGLIENILPKVNGLIIGGAMANTFLAAKGVKIGQSLYEPDQIENARDVLAQAGVLGVRLVLPSEVVVAPSLMENAPHRTVSIEHIGPNDMVVDIAEGSISRWHTMLHDAGTILWNGPIGAYELPPFHLGTHMLASEIAASNAFSVAGGGDTLSAISAKGLEKSFSYLSTGGGALLNYLEGGAMPALSDEPAHTKKGGQ